MRVKMLLTAIIFLCGTATLFANHAEIVRSTVEYPLVKVLADDDIQTLFTDLGLDEENLGFLDWSMHQIPWDVRAEIDSLISENIDDVEDLVHTAMKARVVPESGRQGFIMIGS